MRFAHLSYGLSRGLGCPLSQVECLEKGSGEFLQTKGKTTKPCERLQNCTKEPESVSCRWSFKIPNFCLGSRKHLKGKERKSLCVSMQCKEAGLSFTTQLSGLHFYGWKTHSKWVLLVAGDWERTEDRGIRDNMHNFFLLPLAKRLPVNQMLWEERQKTNTPNLPLQPFSVSFKPNSQIHLVADLMSPHC